MFHRQPRIDIKPNKTDRIILLVGWLVLLAAVIINLSFYSKLPQTVPIHFNNKGVADGFGHKSSLWFFIGFSVVFYFALNLTVTKIRPWKFNFPVKVTESNAPKLYALGIRMMAVMNLVISFIFSILSIIMLYSAFNGNSPALWVLAMLFIPILFPILYFSTKMIQVSKE